MAAIVNNAFGGERPIVQPRLLNDQEAQLAQNVRLVSGRIEPLKAPTEQTTLSGSVSTIFRYGSTSSSTIKWMAWTEEVHAVRSPIANDQWDRVYWTGQGWSPTSNDNTHYPRYAPSNAYEQSGTSYRLGVPAPSATPSAAGTAVVNATSESRSYVFTYTNGATNPTLESVPSKEFTVTAADGFPVNFSNLPTATEGDSRVTHKRIYRKVSSTYRLITTLALDVATYADSATNASLANATALSGILSGALTKPTTAPIATVSTVATTQQSYSRVYVVTFYSGEYTYTQNNGDGGSEQITVQIADSYTSAEITVTGVYDGQQVTIGNLGVPSGITVRGGYKIYRKIPGIGQSGFKLLGTAPIGSTSFLDSTPHGQEMAEGPASPTYTDTTKKPLTPTGTKASYTPAGIEQRVYCMTFANASDAESPPSPTSNTISVTDGQTVTVNVTAAAPSGVTLKRLYRKQASEAASAWRRIAQFATAQTSYSDVIPSAVAANNATLATEFLDMLPSPTKTPTIAAEIPATKVPESRTYVYTFVTEYGEEGPPSPASSVIDIDATKAVTVSGMSTAPSAGNAFQNTNITLKRIYRSSTVGNQAQFQLVPVTYTSNGSTVTGTDVPVAITSVTDNAEQSDLGEVLPSETWSPPPAKLFNLRVLANGIACGFVKDGTNRTVQFSEPFLPHAWPPEYSFATDDEIVGIGVFRQSVAVLTTAYPYIVSGVDPAAMTMTKLELKQGCVSRRSIVETGDGVVYASPDGLFMVGTGGIQNLTQNLFTRDQWQELNPSSMQCFFHDGRIHIVHLLGSSQTNHGMVILDLSGQGAMLTRYQVPTGSFKGGYADASSDALYFLQGGKVWKFNSGTDLAYTWRSKLNRTPYPLNFSCGQVLAESYPLTMKVYADGNIKMTRVVMNANIFTLPSGFRAHDWYYEVTNALTPNGTGTSFPTTGLFIGYVFTKTSDQTNWVWDGSTWQSVALITPAKVYSVSLAQSHAEIKAT